MKTLIFFITQLMVFSLQAQTNLQLASIGDFETETGEIIKNCQIGYRTAGKLNDSKSNVILWPTWFTGTTSDIINFGVLNSLVDTTEYHIILIDALSNGVSSSPSNSVNFPKVISIRDMVNSQHQLLKNILGIDHLKAVMGISMGALQTYEWIIAHPLFMDKAIVIAGTPKLAFYDILLLKTQRDIVVEAGEDEKKLDLAMKRITDINQLHLYTSDYLSRNQSPESLEKYLASLYKAMMNPQNFISQINAVLGYGIYDTKDQVEVQNEIKASVFIVQNALDLTLNHLNANKFAESTNSRILSLSSDCGHLFFNCESATIRKGVADFLKMN